MNVLKFGGTSVGSVENINKVISILSKYASEKPTIGVVSAIGGITDKLLRAGEMAQAKDENYLTEFESIEQKHFDVLSELIAEKDPTVINNLKAKLNNLKNLLDGIFLINELSPKTSDKLLSFGELLSSFIIAETMKSRGMDAARKNSQELIVTNSEFTRAEVDFTKTNQLIKNYFSKAKQNISIIPGFISKSELGEITTLGRGGSDFTAAIVAAALEVDRLEIWTDVSGMYTTNPKMVKQAFPIKNLSYQEAMELSHFGAKVLYPPTVQPVLKKHIPIYIKNTLDPDSAGTKISNTENEIKNPVKGISNINNIVLLTLQGSGMVGIPGFSKRLFETLAQEKINVIFITQASSEHSICLGIDSGNSALAKASIDRTFENEISLNKIDPLIIEHGLSIVALVGDNMKSHQGISGKMFSTLGKNNINIRAIAQGASEKNISAVITEKDVKKALNTLHERFFETKTKQINVYITGVGNVGERLVEQVRQQKSYLKEQLKINLKIVGLSIPEPWFLMTQESTLKTGNLN